MIAGLKPYSNYKASAVAWLQRIPAHWAVEPGFAAYREKRQKNFAWEQWCWTFNYLFVFHFLRRPAGLRTLCLSTAPSALFSLNRFKPRLNVTWSRSNRLAISLSFNLSSSESSYLRHTTASISLRLIQIGYFPKQSISTA